MAQSSANPIIRQDSNLPAIPANRIGFGEGFRFHYAPHTQQAEWSDRRYRKFYSTDYTTESGNDNYRHAPNEGAARELPRLAVPVAARDETGLDPFDRLAFATEISIRYHERRHHHFDNLFRLMMLAIILLSGFALVSGVDARAILGLSIMGIAAGSILWNVTSLSRLHDVLRTEYQNLMEMIRMTPAPQENDLRVWKALRLRIRSKEPPVFWAVANECYYDVARAWDLRPRKRERLHVMLRPLMHWFRF